MLFSSFSFLYFSASSLLVASAFPTSEINDNDNAVQSELAVYHDDLTTIHNVLRRATDQIIEHSRNFPPPEEIPNFMGFVSAYIYFLHSHHTNEDEIVFPRFEAQGYNMTGFEEDHKEFSEMLDSLSAMATNFSTAATTSSVAFGKSDGNDLADLVERMKSALFPHLQREEDLSTANLLSAHNFTDDMIIDLNKRILAKVQTEDASLVLPIIFYHLTEEEMRSFGKRNFPWILRRFIFPYFIARKHKGYWKYSLNISQRRKRR